MPPRGRFKKQRSGSELAAPEAFEDAGLVGEVAFQCIGFYRCMKRLPECGEVECVVDVYPIWVSEELDDWPERERRRRRWFRVTEVAALVNEVD
jgi:hypothetical protein